MAANSEKNGYIGSWLCGEDGAFNPTPIISFDFPEELEGWIPGLTIIWSAAYGEWPTRFRIKAYQGQAEIFSQDVDNDGTTTIVVTDVHNYTRIALEILQWCTPYRRARMEKITFGVQKTYSKSDIMSYSSIVSVDPLSAELPRSEVTFQIKNLDGIYNPDNPHGIEKYLMERQAVTVSYGYELGDGVEWIPGGTFYLSEWETPQNGITATFKARDALEFMTDIYTGPTAGTLYRIAQAAFRQAALPAMPDDGEPWEIHPSLERIFFPDSVDLRDSTIAEVLQYAANASCCTLYQDRLGKFHLVPLAVHMTDYKIDRFNSYANSELVLSKQLKAVDINRGEYVLRVGKKGETQPVVNPFITQGQAPQVAKWIADYLDNRRTLSGEFRADPRLDPLDIVTNINQFSESRVVVTEVKLTYNGAFRGSYWGRGADNLFGHWLYAGELYTGEAQSCG